MSGNRGQRQKGSPKVGGRKKGTPNKVTTSVQTALTKAFELIGDVPAFARWAKENPTEFYRLWSKMLPKNVHLSGADGQPLEVQIYMPANGRDNQTATGSGEVPKLAG